MYLLEMISLWGLKLLFAGTHLNWILIDDFLSVTDMLIYDSGPTLIIHMI